MPEKIVVPRTPFKRLIDATLAALKNSPSDVENTLRGSTLDLWFSNSNYFFTRFYENLLDCLKEGAGVDVQLACAEALRVAAKNATLRIGNDECETLKERFAERWAVPRSFERNSKRNESDYPTFLPKTRDVLMSLDCLHDYYKNYFDEERYTDFLKVIKDEIAFYDEILSSDDASPSLEFRLLLPIWIVKGSSPLYELSVWEDENQMRVICEAVCEGFMAHRDEFGARDVEKRECGNYIAEVTYLAHRIAKCSTEAVMSAKATELFGLMERDDVDASQVVAAVSANPGNDYTDTVEISAYSDAFISVLIANWDSVRKAAKAYHKKQPPSVREMYESLYEFGPDPTYEQFPSDFPESAILKAKLMWDLIGCSIYGPANIVEWSAIDTEDAGGSVRLASELGAALEAGCGTAHFVPLQNRGNDAYASSGRSLEVELGSSEFEADTPDEGLYAVIGRTYSSGYTPVLQFEEDENSKLYHMASSIGEDARSKYYATDLNKDSAWHIGVFLEGEPRRIYLVDLGSLNGSYVIRSNERHKKRAYAFTGRDRGKTLAEIAEPIARFGVDADDIEIVGYLAAKRGDVLVLGDSQFEIF